MDSTVQSQSRNTTGMVVLIAVAVILIAMLVGWITSTPWVYRSIFSIFGQRWATPVVEKGDSLDFGDGKFRLLVGKDLALKLIQPGDTVCVRADKLHIWVLQNEWGERVTRDFPAGRETWYAGVSAGYIILHGNVPDTIVQLTDGRCPSRR